MFFGQRVKVGRILSFTHHLVGAIWRSYVLKTDVYYDKANYVLLSTDAFVRLMCKLSRC